ncbi:MAG TPA: HEAT repeat domain-containing protein [Thermoanaerobaculia bacterium]
MPPKEPDFPDRDDLPRESARTILFQFVIFPLGIVVIAVGVFLLFGKLASDEQSIPDYLNEIRSGSSHERWQAAYQLSKSLKRGEAKRYPNLEQQVASLYVGAKHDDPRIRRYLSMVLGSLGDRKATPLLVDALSEKDVDTRIYALLALADLRDPAAVPAVMTASHDDDKDVRKTALYTLGSIGDRRSMDLLASALTDETADVRYNAAVALARMGDPRAIGVLREMLDRSRLNNVRDMREDQKEEAMIVAINSYTRLVGKNASQDLMRLTRDPNLRVAAAAKEALAHLPR